MTARQYTGPASWVQMELYHLGELPKAEAARIAQYLNESGREDYMDVYIRNDHRPMPPLRIDDLLSSTKPYLFSVFKKAPRISAVACAACAVCIAFFVSVFFSNSKPLNSTQSRAALRIKGGEMMLGVTRNRGNFLTENPKTYMDGDLIKLMLTSSIADPLFAEVIVEQEGELFFPYNGPVEIKTGNRISIPGSIRLTGNGTVYICLLVADPMPSRVTLRSEGLSPDMGQFACVMLDERTETEDSK